MSTKLKPTSFRSADGKPALLSLPEKEAVKALRAAFEKNDDCDVLVGAHPANGRPVEAHITINTDIGGVHVQLQYADNEYFEPVGEDRFVAMDDVDDGEEYSEAQKDAFGKAVLDMASVVG